MRTSVSHKSHIIVLIQQQHYSPFTFFCQSPFLFFAFSYFLKKVFHLEMFLMSECKVGMELAQSEWVWVLRSVNKVGTHKSNINWTTNLKQICERWKNWNKYRVNNLCDTTSASHACLSLIIVCSGSTNKCVSKCVRIMLSAFITT